MDADIVLLSDFVSVKVPGKNDAKISIKKFVESKGIVFAAGSGFYQLSKPEMIQLNKKILVQRISDPKKLITGKSVREVLKIDEKKNKSGKFMVDGDILAEFKIFVQSTSYNRNLIGGTTFLYEKDEDGPSAPKSSRRDPGLVLVSPIGDIDVVPSISSISSSRVPISIGYLILSNFLLHTSACEIKI